MKWLSGALVANGAAALTALVFLETENSVARIAIALAAVVSWIGAFYIHGKKEE